jgi:hypothetical protein
MTELAGSDLPLVDFDGAEQGDLAMAPATFERDAVENNYWWMRQRRVGRAQGDMLSDMSQRLYGDPNKWAEPPAGASVNERINYGLDVGAALMFADLARLRETTPGDFSNYPTSMDDLRERAEAQARVEMNEELQDANNTLGNRSDPTFLGGAASFAGSMAAGVSDVEGAATLPFGAGAGGLARTMLLESLIGGAGAALQIPAQQSQAEFLGTEAPDPVLQVLSGFAFGGLLPVAGRGVRIAANTLTPAGRIENRELLRWGARDGATPEERGATAALSRDEASRDTAREGMNPDDHAARIEAAERDLQDDTIRSEDVIPDVPGERPAFDWDKHRSQGGLREDAISGLDTGFRTSLEDMILSAPPHIRDGLSVFSGYRSIERQQELWDASDKSGKMVARPGHSKHNHGQAVDLEWHGERLDRAPAEVQNWVAANLEKFGLTRPMDYEPWHVEPIGARGGKSAEPAIPRPVIEDGLVPPEEWAPISNGIFAGESGGDWDALFAYSNRAGGPFEDVKLTEMTVDEALAFSDPSGPYGQWVAKNRPDPENGVATPMGAYQIVHTTLQAAKEGLGLTGDELMTPELQEKLGQWIYLEQGTGAWQGYRGPRDAYNTRGPGRYSGGGMVPLGEDAAAAGLFTFDPRTLGVDATSYQFKMGGDQFGVTGRLAGERNWDPNAGIGIMAHERADGSIWVVDGHQRSGLARRLMEEGHPPITLTGTLYRESDGFTKEMVRAMAAMKNIRQESGSPLDAAKILRDDPSLLATAGSRSRPFMLQAQGLADLAPGPFQAIVNEVIPQNYGSIVGRVIPNDDKLQGVAIATLAKAKPANETQAESIIRDIRRLGMEKRADEAQLDMFGAGFKLSDTVISERAQIIDRIMKDARADRALFKRVEQQFDTLQEAGNVLNRSENATRAEIAEGILSRFLILAEQDGPVRDAIDAAARAVRGGKRVGDAADDVFGLLGSRGGKNADGSPADGGAGSGRAEEDGSAPHLTAPRLTELPPDGGGRIAPGLFDDPLEDVAETARIEGLERDLFAALNDPTFDLPVPDGNGGTTSLRAFAEVAREETDFVDTLKTICLTNGARP